MLENSKESQKDVENNEEENIEIKKDIEEKNDENGKDSENKSQKDEILSKNGKELIVSNSISEDKDEEEDKVSDDDKFNEDEEDDDDEVEDIEDEDNNSMSETEKKKMRPYHYYTSSKTENMQAFNCLQKSDYLYGVKQNKYFQVYEFPNISFSEDENQPLIYVKIQLVDLSKPKYKTKKSKIKKLNDNLSYKLSMQKDIINIIKNEDEKKIDINKNKEEIKKEDKTKKKENMLDISSLDSHNYTFYETIKVIYVNYSNSQYIFEMSINMNFSINDFTNSFCKMFHLGFDKYGEKLPLIIIINNKKYLINNSKHNFFFNPFNFSYKNDYVIILERERLNYREYDLGRRANYYNFKGAKVPHFVYSAFYNLEIEGFIVTRYLNYLECEIYELKKEYYFDLDIGLKKATRSKVKELLDLNWKDRCELKGTIKSSTLRKSSENYNANCFEINTKFILVQGKIYIFLVSSLNRKLDAFIARNYSEKGLIIVTKDNRGILNGFKARTISDLTLI